MKLGQKLAYSMGSFANTVCYQAFSNQIQYFYVAVVGLSPAIVAQVWILFGIWNAVNDPLMGQVTDRTRTRWGRRIPFLLFGAIPLGLSFFLMWTPPSMESGWLVVALYMATMVFVFDTLYSLLIMAYNALFPEMVAGQYDRASLAWIREVFSALALLLGLALAPVLADAIGFRGMGAVIGVATAVGYLIAVFGSSEKPPAPQAENIGLWQSVKLTLSHVPFRWFLVANLGKELIFLIVVATMPFYAKYALRLEDGPTLKAGDQEALMLGIPVILTIPMLAIWGRVTPIIGVRVAWIIALLAYIPGLLVMYIAESYTVALFGAILLAPGLAGLMMLPHVLLAEVIDSDAERVGQRREGIFFGINGAAVKLAFSIQGVLFGLVFEITGFVPKAAVQSEAAVAGIRFLLAIAPIFAVILSIVALYCCTHDRREIRSANNLAEGSK